MRTIQFNTRDAELLYSIPEPGADVATLVRCFTFINRTGPPTYGELISCLTKAMKAGILRDESGNYVVDKGWYDRIHMADATAENEIESLLEFEDAFVNVDFYETATTANVLSEDEYRSILAALH